MFETHQCLSSHEIFESINKCLIVRTLNFCLFVMPNQVLAKECWAYVSNAWVFVQMPETKNVWAY